MEIQKDKICINKKLSLLLGILFSILFLIIIIYSNKKSVSLFSRASINNSSRICAINIKTMKNTNNCCNDQELIKGYRCYLNNYSVNCNTKNVIKCGRDNCNNETGLCKNQPSIIISPSVKNSTPTPKSSIFPPKPRRLTPTQIPIPTVSPATLRLEVPWQFISNDNDYNASAHFDFYDGSVKKYYGFFYAYASDDKASKCEGTDIIKDYKSVTIGKPIFITELIPTLYLQSKRTDKGVELYFIYQSKRYDLVKFPKSTNTILVGIDNTRIPNVTKLACLKD